MPDLATLADSADRFLGAVRALADDDVPWPTTTCPGRRRRALAAATAPA
jgi:hypothetical protein